MIQAITYKERQAFFAAQLNNIPVVIPGYEATQLTGDMAVPFRQQSAMLWLTGIEEPGWMFMYIQGKAYLAQPQQSAIEQLFNGGLSKEQAKGMSGVDEVVSIKKARQLLKALSYKEDTIYTVAHDEHARYYSFALNQAPRKQKIFLKKYFKNVEECGDMLRRIMAIKDDVGLGLIRQAIDTTVRAFKKVRQNINSFTAEYEIEALIKSEFRRTGAQGEAYETIVAGGANACTLHYVKNNHILPSNGLVLIDAGARDNGYAADITRTYAIGTPTERQKAVHAAVERAHFKIIELIKPGVSLEDYQKKSDEIMKEALKSLGLLNKPEDYRTYFPHAISHGLGLDVHESLGGYVVFKPGMVLTVEPGIYIPEEEIGVRIEDNILVTEDGNENLSAALPTSL